MSWTKDVLIRETFGEIGLNVTNFNVGPDELNSALVRLDGMMALWNSKGIRLGYAMPSDSDGSDLDQESGLPDAAYTAVICNLALQIAPQYGKTPSMDTRANAKEGYLALLSRAAMPPEQQYQNTVPRGAGSKPWRWGAGNPFMPAPAEPILAGGDGPIEFT